MPLSQSNQSITNRLTRTKRQSPECRRRANKTVIYETKVDWGNLSQEQRSGFGTLFCFHESRGQNMANLMESSRCQSHNCNKVCSEEWCKGCRRRHFRKLSYNKQKCKRSSCCQIIGTKYQHSGTSLYCKDCRRDHWQDPALYRK